MSKRYKRGQIVQHKIDEWLAIYLKQHKKFSYVVRLDEHGNPTSLDTVFTKDLDTPFDVPDKFNQIDITL